MATPDPDLINTGSGFFIDKTTVGVDLSNSRKFSWVQQLGTQVQFGYAGGRYLNMDDIAGGFVAAEGGKKPVANPTVTSGDIAVREWAVVVPVSRRLYRANPQNAIGLIQKKLPEAFARAFDNLATTGAGVSGQSNLSSVTQTVTLASGQVWRNLNTGLKILVQNDRKLTGTVMDAVTEPVINDEFDGASRPLFVDTPIGPETAAAIREGRLLGRPARFVQDVRSGTGTTATVGYMGDWSRLLWGTVGGIEYKVSEEGTYVDDDGTTHSALQENLILFRAEALIGVQVADAGAFVRLLQGTTDALS